MNHIFKTAGLFALFYLGVYNCAIAQKPQMASSAAQRTSEDDTEAGELILQNTNWAKVVKNMNARTLENLARWHNLDLAPVLKQNAEITTADLQVILRDWFLQDTGTRLKVLRDISQ